MYLKLLIVYNVIIMGNALEQSPSDVSLPFPQTAATTQLDISPYAQKSMNEMRIYIFWYFFFPKVLAFLTHPLCIH